MKNRNINFNLKKYKIKIFVSDIERIKSSLVINSNMQLCV